MRWLIALVAVGVLVVGVRSFWTSEPTPENANAEFGAEGSGAFEAQIPTIDPVSPPPSPSEEASLREAVAGTRSPQGDRARKKLVRLLIAKGDAASLDEANQLVDEMAAAGGESAPWAATIAFSKFDEGKAKIERARAIVGMGPDAAAYTHALEVLGDEEAQHKQDSRLIQAWKHYSDAYFSVTDEVDQAAEVRERLRQKLDPIVERLVLSPRPCSEFPVYKVQAGDNLASIAAKNGTTVETIQRVNRLTGTIIHPRQSLKILAGKITIEVDKSEFRLDVRLNGRYLYSSHVGLGRDGGTPLGMFKIATKMEKPTWFKRGEGEVPYGHPDNPLGERWLGFRETQEYSGYGIHGTDEPETIGTESSAGCVRMRNEDVIALYPLIPRGTEVTIRE